MIASKATYLRVGLLLTAGLAAAIGLVLFLSRGEVRDGWKFESYFRESVQGLDVGAPVKFRGVTLGQVTDIGLVGALYPDAVSALPSQGADQSSFQLVVVRYTVDPKRTGRISDADRARVGELGLRSRLATQGITGLAYIELDFVNPTKFPIESVPWKPRDDVIPSMPSTIAQVQDAAQALLAKLQAVDFVMLTGGIQTVLNDLHAQLAGGELHDTFAEAKLLLRGLNATVEQANLPAVAADLKATSASVRKLLEGKQTTEMIRSASLAADRFAEAARKLPPLIDTLQTAVRRADNGVGDLQHDIAPVLRDARAAAANLRETTETLRRYPTSVLLGAPPPRESGR
jgi:paraquat-inducible protein B